MVRTRHTGEGRAVLSCGHKSARCRCKRQRLAVGSALLPLQTSRQEALALCSLRSGHSPREHKDATIISNKASRER